MDNNLKEAINNILSKVSSEWTTNEKIRYIYIQIGKILNKDVSFFYTLFGFMGSYGYDYFELKEKMEQNYSVIQNDYKVICKSAVEVLKYALDQLNIESKILNTIAFNEFNFSDDFNKKISLHHYFLCVTGDNDKNYFLSIVPDLMNIQYNLETEHFAGFIGNKANENEKIYEGEEIKYDTLSREEIRKLDQKIGYLKKIDDNNYSNYDNDLIKLVNTSWKQLHLELLIQETPFYRNVFRFRTDDNYFIDLQKMNILDLSESELKNWVDYIKIVIKNTDLTDELLNKALLFSDLISEQTKLIHKCETDKERKNIRNKINMLLLQTGKLYLNKNSIYDCKSKKEECKTEYIKHKFELLFPYIMGCNNTDDEDYILPITSKFNGHAEAINFIDLILENLFPEISLENSKNIKNIDIVNNVSILKTRINKVTIFDKINLTYSIIFLIDNTYFYYFNPNDGEFKEINKNKLFDYATNYIIVSNKLKNKIFTIEDDEIMIKK
ncbi:MAG: hypothetical protein PHN42_04525 [Bacilli bacterium]|nr:hypothetical protein [Bacilli bacterium]